MSSEPKEFVDYGSAVAQGEQQQQGLTLTQRAAAKAAAEAAEAAAIAAAQKIWCNVCKGHTEHDHHMSICPALWNLKTVTQRKDLTRQRKCCFHCGGKGHIAKYCPARNIKHNCHNDGEDHWLVFCPQSPGIVRVDSLNPDAEVFQPEGQEVIEKAVASNDAAAKVTQEVTAAADAQAAKEGVGKIRTGMTDYATHASFGL